MPSGVVSTPQVNRPSGGAINQNLAEANVVNKAAAKWHVPAAILWGVFGLETSFGSDIKTSSAGAQGPFQFLPSTAATYGYPLTNAPNAAQFAQQADAAAKYLSVLYHQTGSWDSALRHYSGNGYGLSEVQKEFAKNPGVVTGGTPTIPGKSFIQGIATGPLGDAAQAVSGALTVPAKFLALITSLEFWLRLGEGIAGLVLIAMGLKVLTGVSVPTPYGKV